MHRDLLAHSILVSELRPLEFQLLAELPGIFLFTEFLP